jgi:ABC-type transport system involved in Fe-S cluster assembly fused permease/ATPase subunit
VPVEFHNVSFHYATQDPSKGLQNVSFCVDAGTTTAVVGHTGSGKTTISRLLFRFYDPTEGFVSIDGHNIRDFTQKSVRQAIGIVPQDTVLFNDTIVHNVRYGKMDASMDEIKAAADAAQIRTFIEGLPEGWDTKVGERGLKLSGGEKQRVAIARCLLKNPPVVLLDEATSALDTITEHSVQEALNTLGRKRTVVIIAHRLSTIRQAHQIIVSIVRTMMLKTVTEQFCARF